MRLRTVFSLALLAFVAAAAIVLPGTPAVRGAVVHRALEAATEAGFDVVVAGTGGNLWRGVTLRGVEITGPGTDATAETIRVRYFLPPLITGELPIGLHVDGLGGSIDMATLGDALAAPNGSAPPAVRVRLQDVDVTRSRLAVAGIPFTLPDIGIEGMRVSTSSDGITADLELVTAEGRAELIARTRPGSSVIEIEVVAADTTIGRHWWDGIRGGTGRGVVRVVDGVVSGDLTIEGGALTALGVDVRDVSGPVTWRGTDIEADLTGAVLGGTISATGQVDALAQRWQATGSADAELDEVVAALWALGAPGAPVPSSGRVRADVRAEGWTLAHIDIDALAEGTLLGEPLEALGAHVVWDSLAGLSADVGGGWGGGTASARIRSVRGASHVVANVRDATWSGIALDVADADFRLGAQPHGEARVIGSWSGPFGTMAIESDLALDADGALLFLHADAGDLVIEGAVVAPGLYGDAPLDGSVHVRTPAAWFLGEAPTVSLDVLGALGTPRIAAIVDAPQPVRPALPGIALDLDLRGTVTAELAPGGVEVGGALGQVRVDGGWGGGRALALAAERVALVEPVRTELTDARALIEAAATGWLLQAGADLAAVETSLPFLPLRVDPIGPITLRGDGMRFEVRDEAGRIELVFDGDETQASFADLGIVLGDMVLSASGSAERPEGGAWTGDAQVSGTGLEARLEADADGVSAELTLAAGTAIGPWRAGSDVRATGTLGEDGFTIDALAAGLRAGVSGTLDEGLAWDAFVQHEGGRVEASGGEAGWSARGSLPLEPLLDLAGVAVAAEGAVELELGAPAGEAPAGTVRLSSREAVPWGADIVVGAGRADLVASGTLLGETFDARGQIWPSPDATLSWGPIGPVQLSAEAARGTGTVPAITLAGVRIAEQAWSLEADLAAATATATLGASEASASWAGPASARLRVDQPLAVAGADARLSGDVTWSADAPAGGVALVLESAALALSASVDGDLAEASVRANAPAGALADALGAPVDLAGGVSLTGVASLLTPSGRLQAEWRVGDERMAADLEADAEGWAARVSGPGLTAEATPDAWSITADAFDPGRWLVAPDVAATLDGTLQWQADAWSGDMHALVAAPFPLNVAVRGQGDALVVDARAEGAFYEGSLVGYWGAAPRFEVAASVADPGGGVTGRVDALGSIARSDGEWTGRGAIAATAGEAGRIAWRPLAANWVWEEGRLRLGGSEGVAGVLNVALDGVTGAWQLPVEIGGLGHRLRLEAGAELAATLGGPSIDLAVRAAEGGWRLAGTALARDAWVLGGEAPAWTEALGTVAIEAGVRQDAGTWLWSALASATVTQGERRWPLTLTASGVDAAGSGTLAVGPDDASAARVSLDLRAGVATARIAGEDVDVAGVGRMLAIPIAGDLAGHAALSIGDGGLDVRGDLRAELSYAGVAFRVAAASDAAGPWSVRAETQDGTWTASASAPDRATLAGGGATVALAGPDTALRGRLSAHGDTFALRLGGSVAGRTASLSLAGDPGAATGQAAWGASRLDVDLGAEGLSARAHVARADAPAGPWSVLVDVDRASWDVTRATVHALGADARLELGGATLPVDLSGRAALGDLDRSVRVRQQGDGAWRLDLDTLGLTLTPDGRVQGDGAASVTVSGARIDLDLGTLAWRGGDGWTGDGSVTVSVPSLGAHVDVVATGAAAAAGGAPLLLDVVALRDGSGVGGARLDLPADFAGALQGVVDLDLELFGEGPTPWRLAAAGPIAGTLSAPVVDADLRLTGPVGARGRLHVERGGLRADLAGEDLIVSARLDGSGWRAQARVTDADVSAFVPWVVGPRLDLAVEARSGDGGIEVVADTLRLRGPTSSVAGQGRLSPDGELRITFRSDVDLADLRVGTDLAGRLHGPLTLRYDLGAAWTEADLTGMLAVTDAAVGGVPGTFSGDVQVAGPTADPRLLATLQARGDATGTVRADVRPRRGTGRIDADVQAGALHATLRAALEGPTLTADGRVAVDGLAVTLASDAQGVRVIGEGGLMGWTGRMEAHPWTFDVAGDLASLTPLARGTLEAGVTWPSGGGLRPVLTGAWHDVAAGPLAIPDAAIRTADDGTVVAEGAGVAARLHLPSLVWSADLAGAGVSLGDDALTLDLRAAGTGADAAASFALAGTWQGQRVDLDGRAELGASLALTTAGDLLGGSLRLEATRGETLAWSGEASLAGAELAGSPLEATITLSGDADVPEGAADVRWGDELVRASAGFRDGRLETLARVALPGAAALSAAGSLWPALDLAITSDAGDTLSLRGSWTDDEALTADGSLAVELAGVQLRLLAGSEGAAHVEVRLPSLLDGVVLAAGLPLVPPAELLAIVGRDGVVFDVSGAGEGRLRLDRVGGAWGAQLDDVTLPVAGGHVRAHGRFAPGAGALDVTITPPEAFQTIEVQGLSLEAPIEGRIVLDGSILRLTSAAPWTAIAEVDLERRTARLDGDLGWDGPDGRSRVSGSLVLDAGGGARGDVDVERVHVSLPGAAGGLRLDGRVSGAGGALQVQATARARRSSVALSATVPLAPLARAGWAPATDATLAATARVSALDLEDLPWLTDRAPGVAGIVTGSVVVRDGQLLGQLVAEELALAGTELPATLTLAGDAGVVDARLEVGTRRQAILTGSWRDGQADMLARLERFPLHTVVEAIVGRSDVTALVTGVARAGWDPSRADALDLRLATEDIRLERAGVVTTGTVTFELSDGALVIREASFAGSGTWSARGEIRPDRLDLELVAVDADFGPLLGLIPAFARYGVAAEGDLELIGRGTLDDPTLRLRSEGLRVSVAGTSYEMSEAALDLVGESLAVAAVVRGVAPLGGEVRLSGDGIVRLQPFDLVRADLRAVGDIDVPVIGRVTDVDAAVRSRSGSPPTVRLDGRLGAPLRIEGTLAPFDVRGVGQGLVIGVPDIFVASATIDTDLRARVDDGVVVGGRIDVSQARLDLSARAEARAAAEGPDTVRNEASRRAALQLLRFDGVRITAPQRVTLSETIGTAEASIDLTLTGDAADPRLEGAVNALRGTFRFSGQDLELTRGVARFESARGILPVLEIEARARFEKARVAQGSDIRFTAPPGPRFDVVLRFEAEVSTSGPGGAVNVDLVPQLTSDALVEVASGADGLSAGTRGLSELELLSLIALGRIEVGGGTEALASTFAQRALDTAVDLLVVAELQAALSEALGLDVVEIRTTALSDIFDGRTDPFGVSLRFGGYLSDELFASYRVGTFDDAEREFAVTNELAFTYELGPVAFDLAGRIDFPSIATNAPVPSLAASVRYDVSRTFAFEAALDVGSSSQTARFGVTIRW